MVVLKTQDLKKYYKSGEHIVKALNNVNLEIEKGSFVSVVGSSGSGKSTLLNLLGGLDYPTAGSVTVDGICLSDLNQEEQAIFRRRKVGFVFQTYHLLPMLNVYENIIFPLQLDRSRVDLEFMNQIIIMLKLGDRLSSFPDKLSGGQQQRVAIARALVFKPSIVLADEPTGNLDSKTSQDVMGLLRMTSKRFHQTMVMITHNEELAQLADRIIHIEDGRVMEH